MSSLLLDFSTALRFFARRKASCTVIVLTMGLALAANTSVFSVLHAFLFEKLGIPEAERVALIWTTRNLPGRGRVDFSDAYPNYLLLREATRSFSALSATVADNVNWEEKDETRRVEGFRVTASFFDVTQVRPVMGRAFTPQEEGPRAAPVAIISHSLWRSAFQGSADVLGRSVRMNGVPHTIVGVMPTGFEQPRGANIWLPLDLPEAWWKNIIGARQLVIYARLAPGVSFASADKELASFAVRAVEADPNNKEWSWRAQSLQEFLLAGSGNVVLFVQAGAAVLLLLAVCNLASLLMAWAVERQRQTAVRLALGASTWRIVRQFIVQSLLLALAGGALAIGLAWFALPALQRLNPNPLLASLLKQVELDGTTILFASILILITGLLGGLLPAWQTRSVSLTEALRTESRGGSQSPTTVRWQQAMVVFQAAISVLILICAALTGLGLAKLGRVRLGFASENRVAFRIQLPEPAYDTHEKRAQFVRTLEQNLAQEPILASYGITTTIPVGDIQRGGNFLPQLPTGDFVTEPLLFHLRRATPGYLRAMAIPLLEGRLLDQNDTADKPPVAVVSKALAEKYWPGESALGRKVKHVSPPHVREIVGVVGNIHDSGPGVPASETIYIPFDQMSFGRAWVVLHSRGSIGDAVAAGRRALRAAGGDVAAFDINTLPTLASQAIVLQRLQVLLFALFASIAIGITALGTYGVMSQLVSIREKELAIRAALGAPPGSVLRLVLWQNARLAILGVVAGIVAAWLGSQWLQSKLTSFEPSSFWPFAVVAIGVLVLTQIASFLPARRATNLDVQTLLSSV
jgi:putative ABC transport system permease protein